MTSACAASHAWTAATPAAARASCSALVRAYHSAQRGPVLSLVNTARYRFAISASLPDSPAATLAGQQTVEQHHRGAAGHAQGHVGAHAQVGVGPRPPPAVAPAALAAGLAPGPPDPEQSQDEGHGAQGDQPRRRGGG